MSFLKSFFVIIFVVIAATGVSLYVTDCYLSSNMDSIVKRVQKRMTVTDMEVQKEPI